MPAGWMARMGVIYGLEVARALGRGIDVAGWADEEGHYGSFLGSRSFCGLVDEAELDACRNRDDGTPLRDGAAARRAGGAAAGGARSGALSRLPGGAYRAGRGTGDVREAARRGDQHRRRAEFPHHASRACRTMPAPRAWRSGAMPAWRWCGWPRDRPAVSADRRAAHRLDHRPHHPGARRAQHRPRPRRDAVPVPRHRPGDARPAVRKNWTRWWRRRDRGPAR